MFSAAVNGSVALVPATDWAPLQAPLATQLVAPTEFHLKVAAPPVSTLTGLADSTIVGADMIVGSSTATVSASLSVPPGPEQARANVLTPALSGGVTSEPAVS